MDQICADWVEEHKFETDEGLFISDDGGETLDGPYSEEAADDILWDRAVSGEAIEPYIDQADYLRKSQKEGV